MVTISSLAARIYRSCSAANCTRAGCRDKGDEKMHAKNAGFLSSISFLAWWGCAVAQTYTVVDLGLGQAWSINDEGQVVGSGYCNPRNEFAAQIWSGGTCSPLGPANLGYPAALAINNAGLVVGSAFSSGTTDAILF